MVNNITDKAYVKGGEVYGRAPEFNGTTIKTAGNERRDSSIPLQVWEARAGKAMNILREKVRYRVDPASGGVVMVTGSNNGGTGRITGKAGTLADGVIHPGGRAKGSLINRRG